MIFMTSGLSSPCAWSRVLPWVCPVSSVVRLCAVVSEERASPCLSAWQPYRMTGITTMAIDASNITVFLTAIHLFPGRTEKEVRPGPVGYDVLSIGVNRKGVHPPNGLVSGRFCGSCAFWRSRASENTYLLLRRAAQGSGDVIMRPSQPREEYATPNATPLVPTLTYRTQYRLRFGVKLGDGVRAVRF